MTTYTTTRVAKLCGLSPHTVLKAFDSGDLKGFRVPGSLHRRVPDFALREWAVKHRIPLPNIEPAEECPVGR
jgi:two-component system, OmpR family, response regulator RpaA